ncbi:plasma membrane fusion protein prm1 [Lecanora helva]
MASNQHRVSFPNDPSPLSPTNHGVRDDYDSQNTQRPTPHTISNITPYLGLRSRLSQVWINRWTILLFLVLARVLIAIAGLNNNLGSAKTEAMSACTGVEDMGSTMASMPHYLSAGVNELAASGVEKAVHGLHSMLLMTITGVEELLVFYVNMLTSTYMCLITLVVSGSLHAALALIEDVTHFLNGTVKEIGKDLATGIKDFQDSVNVFTKGINAIPEAFGKKNAIPQINETENLNKLQNLEIPTSVDKELTKLNNSIPTFQDVQNFTDNVLRLPFEEVKKLLNGKANFTFDRAVLPVPQKEKLSFCSDNNGINGFFDDLAKVIDVARKVFIAVLVILAILVCVPMALQEYRRWNTMKKRSELVADKSFDPLDVIYIASRPYTATAGIKASAPFQSSKRQVLTRWVIAYATSTPALVVLSLGVTGLFACLCQYILLKVVEKEVPALAHDVGNFADVVMGKLNNASEAWANGTNTAISGLNKDINHDIFGWVNTTTGAINNTLNVFINDTIGELNKTFGGTILYGPVTGIFECLIGLKVASIEKGLTWVSDNAHVEFPLLNNNTFSLGAAASLADGNKQGGTSDFLAAPGADATDRITNAVVKVANHVADGIKTEAIISTVVLLIWVIIVLSGIARALYLNFHSDKNRAVGGPSYAGDIPMEAQTTANPVRGGATPAPAYEPPRNDSDLSDRGFPSFREPMGHHAPDDRGSDDWQDEKLGFGGMREPTHVEAPRHESVYPSFEKS